MSSSAFEKLEWFCADEKGGVVKKEGKVKSKVKRKIFKNIIQNKRSKIKNNTK